MRYLIGHVLSGLLILFGITALSGLLGPLQAAGLGVSPSAFSLAVEPGRTYTGSFTLSSFGDHTVAISVGDWLLDATGAKYYPAQPVERSLAKWIEVTPVRFAVKQGKPQMVRYRLTVPATATGSNWGMIFAETVQGQGPASKGAVGLVFRPRIGIIIIAQTARGAVMDGQVEEVRADWSAQDGLHASVTFKNTGNTIVQIKGRFEIKDRSGVSVANAPFGDKGLMVLPHAKRIITGDLRAQLKSGNYVLLAIIDFGVRKVIAGQRPFKVP